MQKKQHWYKTQAYSGGCALGNWWASALYFYFSIREHLGVSALIAREECTLKVFNFHF